VSLSEPAKVAHVGFALLPRLKAHNAEIAQFVRARFAPELSRAGMQTKNDLQDIEHPLVTLMKTEFLQLAERELGEPAVIRKMWGYMQEGGNALNQRKLLIHAHRADLSLVYYAAVPQLTFPEGTFTLALPDLVHVMPVEGLVLTFGRELEHEAFPAPSLDGLRVSVAASLDRQRGN